MSETYQELERERNRLRAEASIRAKEDENKRYIVVRVYSHTDRQLLWKVLSRPIPDKRTAEAWMEFMRDEEKKKHPRMKHDNFMIVEINQ